MISNYEIWGGILMEELILKKRIKNSSNSARKERRHGMVPGIIYG